MNRPNAITTCGLVLALTALLGTTTALSQLSSVQTGNRRSQTLDATQPSSSDAAQATIQPARTAGNRAHVDLLGALSIQTQPGHTQSPLSTALIVLTTEASQQALPTLTEDLNVMCRIFDLRLSQNGLRHRDIFTMIHNDPGWIERVFADQFSWTHCIYVEGHGPLFQMSVDFPLVPPRQTSTAPDPNGPHDPVWAAVAEDLRHPSRPGRPRRTQRGPAYNPEKFLTLKTALTKALAHAVNIRALTDDTVVTVLVRGKRAHDYNIGAFVPNSDMVILDTGHSVPFFGNMGHPGARPSFLVIRAALKDIRAFAAKDIPFAEFEKRVGATQY